MTNEERENAIRCLKLWIEREPQIQTYKICLEALEQHPCDDAVSRQSVHRQINEWVASGESDKNLLSLHNRIDTLTPVVLQQKIGRCKDCQYFQYDRVAVVDGIPATTAHEICTTWGDGC